MDITKVSALEATFAIVLFPFYWIAVPIMYLTQPFNWFELVLITFSIWVLISTLMTLKKISEPYELERVHRYWDICMVIKPKAYVFITGLLGYAVVQIASPITDITVKLNCLFFGSLLIILSLRWWEVDTNRVKIPNGDTL
jgi:TctA family transporter